MRVYVFILKGLVIGVDFARADVEGVFDTLEGAKKGLLEMINIVKENEKIINVEIKENGFLISIDTESDTFYEYV